MRFAKLKSYTVLFVKCILRGVVKDRIYVLFTVLYIFINVPKYGISRADFPGNGVPGNSAFPGKFPSREFPVLNPRVGDGKFQKRYLKIRI